MYEGCSGSFVPVGTICRDYKPQAERLSKFRFWHVESLLNQGADLLDRCLRDRSEYESLRSQCAMMMLQVEKDKRELQILNERVAKGWLDQPGIVLDKEEDTNREMDNTGQKAVDLALSQPEWAHEGGPPPEYQKNLSAIGFQLSSLPYFKQSQFMPQRKQWAADEKHFRQREIESKRIELDSRLKLMSDGEALDYSERAVIVLQRIARDLEDALDRLIVAAEGLETLYGHVSADIAPWDRSLKDLSRLDAAVFWTRSVIKWLVAFGQLDQACTYAFSMKSMLGSAWDTAIQDAKISGEANLTFSTTPQIFSNYAFVRLRGISASLVGINPDEGFWKAEVKVPKLALSRQISDGGHDQFIEIDQQAIPSCYLGRIDARSSFRPPEIGGAISLMNSSPISVNGKDGEWFIKLIPPTNASAFNAVDDFFLELNVVGRPGL